MEHLLFVMFAGSCGASIRSRMISDERSNGVQSSTNGAHSEDSSLLEMRAVTQLQQNPSTDSTPMEGSNGHALHLEEAAVEHKQAEPEGEYDAKYFFIPPHYGEQ